MPRITLRLAAAIVTFTLGLSGVWLTNLGARLTDATLELLMPTPALDTPAEEARVDSLADTYAVYSKVINEMFLRDEDVRLVVIEREAGGGCGFTENEDGGQRIGPAESFTDWVNKAMPTVQPETLADYRARQATKQQLTGLFALPVAYVLVGEDELDRLSGPSRPLGFWENFYARYPHSAGLTTFSNVGFNRAHTQAFVYVAHGCGGLCGEGDYVLLEKRDGRWQIVGQQMIWIS